MNDSNVHRIRLKGPWDVLPPHSATHEFERHSMPISWRELFGETPGTAVFRRNFHTPSGLSAKDRVLIYVPPGTGLLTEFQVNQVALPSLAPQHLWRQNSIQFEVTNQLGEFNQLTFAITFDPSQHPKIPGGLWESVSLEIYPG